MPLKDYHAKRDFRSTPEPKGARAKGRSKRAFVVQKHDASRLHYDFRLALDGVLKSWAVPKGPSVNPADKRLAVAVEDHPLEYADFEGVIPKGQYGAGAVMVWDSGTWSTDEKDPHRAIKKGKLSFTLTGEKLKGGWTLTRMGGRGRDGDVQNWLLIKHDDAAASKRKDPLEQQPESVASGRSLDEIAEAADAKWASDGQSGARGQEKKSGTKGKRSTTKGKRTRPGIAPSKVSKARKAAFPRDLRPQLATLVEHVPSGGKWIHEIKFDGYRLLVFREGDRVQLMTRNGKNWSKRFGPLIAALRELPLESAIIDGEVTILDDAGRSSFQRLQNAIKAQRFASLAFFAFDLPYCNGYDLTGAPLHERKRLLQRIVPATDEGMVRFSEHLEGEGEEIYTHACKLELEGIVSKRADSAYAAGRRTPSWVKVKCARRQEFVVIGWTRPAGARKHFGALLLAAHDQDERLHYVGRVGTGFDAAALRDIKQQLDGLERKTCPADTPPPASERRGVRWVKPELVAEVAFAEWTDDGRLRQPSFQGLREDREVANVHVEKAKPVNTKGAGRPAVAGVGLSHADRVVYPEQGVTKLDLAQYYARIADWILPHLEDRPLSTVRCPKGRTGQCFYQKHMGDTFSAPVKPVAVAESSGKAQYLSVDSLAGLVTLVQFGVLEIHPWGARTDDLERPDRITFDLDPGEGAAFDHVREGAKRVRALLEEVDLACYLKTTGGKGLHVVVPLTRRADWDDVKEFAAAVAKRIAKDDPDRFVATSNKSKRRGKVYVDYLRNSRGATAVAPFSTRARPGAPVAVPLRWDELNRLDAADAYTVENLAQRITRLKHDPWEGFLKQRQQLTPARMRHVA